MVVLVYICEKGMGESISTPYHTTLSINWFLNNQDMLTSMERHDVQTRLMIWRKKMLNKGFTSNEYKQFEKDVYNGYLKKCNLLMWCYYFSLSYRRNCYG